MTAFEISVLLHICSIAYSIPKKVHVSISSTFYNQLLCSQVPKVPNGTANLTVFFEHLGSACVNAACRTVMELIPWISLVIRGGYVLRVYCIYLKHG